MTPDTCNECARLMVAYISAVRSARKVFEAKDQAAQAGLIDDTSFLDTESYSEQALTEQQQARKAYHRHRRKYHGTPVR